LLEREPDSESKTALTEELSRATVVASEEIPAGVVTMNSIVRCVDDLTGKRFEVTLVYPGRSTDERANPVSILAPFGTALLGLSVGQSINWQVPGGKDLSLRILEVVYQPESEGDFHR
jgi:regulator of nucleoside diphosphate kinase